MLFMLELEPDSYISNSHYTIFDIKRFLPIAVNLEKPRKQNQPKSCYNCQDTGTLNAHTNYSHSVSFLLKHSKSLTIWTNLAYKDKTDGSNKNNISADLVDSNSLPNLIFMMQTNINNMCISVNLNLP